METNNCTSFGLAAAKVAGIGIGNTSGSWAGGLQKGDNPADAGQSVLEGNVKNTTTGNKNGLIINTQPAEYEQRGF